MEIVKEGIAILLSIIIGIPMGIIACSLFKLLFWLNNSPYRRAYIKATTPPMTRIVLTSIVCFSSIALCYVIAAEILGIK
jgi:putative effector of murein hydrolase